MVVDVLFVFCNFDMLVMVYVLWLFDGLVLLMCYLDLVMFLFGDCSMIVFEGDLVLKVVVFKLFFINYLFES